MEKRSITVNFEKGNITGISLNAQLDTIYKKLFQNARKSARRRPHDIEHGIKIIIFGCFWLEAHCNQTFKAILEMETKDNKFGTSIWKRLKRSNIFNKLEIIKDFSSKQQKDKYINFQSRLKSVFDLRNRLAHFKDEEEILSEATSLEEAMNVISTLPIPDINHELMWPQIKHYAETISEANKWLISVYQTYRTRNGIKHQKKKHQLD